jgi:tetratricopeptide (TPR) repeat protein
MTGCCLFIAFVLSAMNIDSLTASLHVETGFAYIDQGLPDKALGEFTKALEICGNSYDAYLGLGRIAVLNGSWVTAEEQYSTYMSFKPEDYRAPLEMALMFLSLPGRTQDAQYYSDTALSLAPLNGQCWLAAAEVSSRLGALYKSNH